MPVLAESTVMPNKHGSMKRKTMKNRIIKTTKKMKTISRNALLCLAMLAFTAACSTESISKDKADDKTVEQLKADSNYNTTQTVSNGKLVPLGISSFKLDYYSALAMAETLAAAYSG